ncbi:DUF6250 domain-containing protein [Coraliomargarita algicola]|uniref:DUF6250 domain-containing protein n=1 Tax=Coraliomargarita algicola TaxID=3092156 RepID=UPI003CE48E68
MRPDTPILVELTADNGKVQVFRDGALIFEFDDPEFLASGWFGIRTVNSHLKDLLSNSSRFAWPHFRYQYVLDGTGSPISE